MKDRTAPSISEADASAILQFAAKQGKLDVGAMLDKMNNMEREEILKKHKYAITHWQKAGKEYYCTYLPNPNPGGRRICKKRRTLEELQNIIIEFYKSQERHIRFETVWREYIDQKLEYGEIQKSSYDRYNNDFDRYFVSREHNLKQKLFINITSDDLERFIKTAIKELGLTQKSYEGLRTIIRGTFKYGKKHHYTSLSITEFFGDLELPRNIFSQPLKEVDAEVFREDEVPVIKDVLWKHATIRDLGILLTFETGLRVGELSALKASDIDGRVIRVRRTEVKERGADHKWIFVIKEHAKTAAGARDLIIPSTAQGLIKAIITLNPHGEYLFEEDGHRIISNAFNKRLAAICKQAGLPVRSMHKIRKTYGTVLVDSGMDDKLIQEQMGHRDIETTRKYYYYSNKSLENKEKQVDIAFR